jgi:putative flippase GtrA
MPVDFVREKPTGEYMRNSVVQDNLENLSALTSPEEASPLSPSSKHTPSQTLDASESERTYQPYPWEPLNSLLDMVDDKTNGRAGWLQRFVNYLFFGGLAALVNLFVFYVTYYHVFTRLHPEILHNSLSYIVAAECSILANFIPNDRFTFNKLPGARRPWLQRCTRFHMTAIVGTLLTFVIELSLSTFIHITPVISEAIATLIVLVYNFSFHHIFTYRHIKHA